MSSKFKKCLDLLAAEDYNNIRLMSRQNVILPYMVVNV